MSSSSTLVVRGNAGRRLYVFFAVALAVFILAIALVGIACRGFAQALPSGVATQQQQQIVEAKAVLAAADDDYRSAHHATEQALHAYETARAELNEFASTRFAGLSDEKAHQIEPPNENAAGLEIAPTSPDAENQAAAPVATDPRLYDLQDRLEKLKRRRTDLTATMLPTHPSVRYVDLAIADVEAEIAKLPVAAPNNGQPRSAGPDISRNTGNVATLPAVAMPDNSQHQIASKRHESEQRHRELVEHLNQATQNHLAAVEREAEAKSRRTSAATKFAALSPVSAPPAGGANPRAAIFMCALLAIAAGVIVARGARLAEAVFHTVAEVRQRLGLTVLGVLPTEPRHKPPEKPRTEPRWIGRAVVAAELCLVAVLVVVAAAAIGDHQFFRDFLANPMAACSDKFFC